MIKKYLVAVSLLITLVANALANIIPYNGLTTKEVSDLLPSFFVPAPYVFSIWSVIYLGLIAYVIYTFVKHKKIDEEISLWFIIANIANAIWMFTWHYQIIWLTVILMLVILASLLVIYIKLNRKDTDLIRKAPFSIYLGWISVATIANISSMLNFYGWDGFGISEPMWSTIMIGVATALAILMLQIKKDFLYALVILWAIIGIMFKFLIVSDLMVGAIITAILVIITNIALVTIKTRE